MKRNLVGKVAFWFALLIISGFIYVPRQIVKAQGPSGFTKIGTVTAPTLTYSDLAVTAGQAYIYAVTAVNAAGESQSGSTTSPAIPTTAPTGTLCEAGSPLAPVHCAVISWTPMGGGSPTNYNVYRQVLAAPNPPAVSNSVQVQ